MPSSPTDLRPRGLLELTRGKKTKAGATSVGGITPGRLSHEGSRSKPARDFSPKRALAGLRAYERFGFRRFPRLRRFPAPTGDQCL